jgi:hypothetical protein
LVLNLLWIWRKNIYDGGVSHKDLVRREQPPPTIMETHKGTFNWIYKSCSIYVKVLTMKYNYQSIHLSEKIINQSKSIMRMIKNEHLQRKI